jgi:hypothetical protein
LNPPGIPLVEDFSAELAHKIGVVHLSGPPQTRQSHTKAGWSEIQEIVYGIEPEVPA